MTQEDIADILGILITISYSYFIRIFLLNRMRSMQSRGKMSGGDAVNAVASGNQLSMPV